MQINNPVSGGGGGGITPKPFFGNGLTTFTTGDGTGVSPLSLSADEGYLVKITLDGSCTISPFLDVTTASAAGGKAYIALYNVGTGGAIGSLVNDFTEMAVDATGKVAAGSAVIPGGEYFLVYQVSLACSLRCVSFKQPSSFENAGSVINAIQSRIRITTGYVYPPPAGGSVTTSISFGSDGFAAAFCAIS